jgi:hypothetical protein
MNLEVDKDSVCVTFFSRANVPFESCAGSLGFLL